MLRECGDQVEKLEKHIGIQKQLHHEEFKKLTSQIELQQKEIDMLTKREKSLLEYRNESCIENQRLLMRVEELEKEATSAKRHVEELEKEATSAKRQRL
jgi:hypothetical protein